MRYEALIRNTLVENTIHLIAEGGFEKATTRAITHDGYIPPEVKLNEVYIYRIFGGKEELYAEAFRCLDCELINELNKDIDEFCHSSNSIKQNFKILFDHLWSFVLRNEDHCRCYVRYYYSVYYKGASQKMHHQFFDQIVKRLNPIFKPEADVKSLLHSVFTTLLDFAIRVYNGDIPDNQDSADHIFNVLYLSISSYFKQELVK